jgi:hypothetical protein
MLDAIPLPLPAEQVGIPAARLVFFAPFLDPSPTVPLRFALVRPLLCFQRFQPGQISVIGRNFRLSLPNFMQSADKLPMQGELFTPNIIFRVLGTVPIENRCC